MSLAPPNVLKNWGDMNKYIARVYGIRSLFLMVAMSVFAHSALSEIPQTTVLSGNAEKLPEHHSGIRPSNNKNSSETNHHTDSTLTLGKHRTDSQTSHSLSNPMANLTQVFIALVFVVLLIFLIAWFLKRVGYSGMQAHPLMTVKASLPLSTKEKLLIVEIGEEQVVIGVAPGFVGHIKSLDAPLDFSHTKNNESFSAAFNQLIKGKALSD